MKVMMHRPLVWTLGTLLTLICYVSGLQAEPAVRVEARIAAQIQTQAQTQDSIKIEQTYPQTIAVLQTLYRGEVLARERHLAFAAVAVQEEHDNIAYLFKALAASEEVHAKNFGRILSSLGIEIPDVDLSTIQVLSTKQHLKFTVEIELGEIDTECPAYLRRIAPEKHKEDWNGWQSEKQYKGLLKQIKSGTGFFFSTLVKRFRNQSNTYYVNQNCGGTVTELPARAYPLCYNVLDTYVEISRAGQIQASAFIALPFSSARHW